MAREQLQLQLLFKLHAGIATADWGWHSGRPEHVPWEAAEPIPEGGEALA